VPLSSLVSKDRKVPLIVERLIAIVELHGMYTEGLYRRAGAQSKVKLLKQLMDSGKEGWSDVQMSMGSKIQSNLY
jgi:hypothetical protein